mmetsp:Transcript_11647/g.13658  ORF Transcript_11647/g.13658 Transcript_11647/m.13658 type:complete len:104 (-) Transcript_11647:16-327(-)
MNGTLVETYQRTHGQRTSFLEHFTAIFGPSWWTWPIPFPSAPEPDYTEPALADEAEIWSQDTADDHNSLGIAGEESEEMVQEQEPAARPRLRYTRDGSEADID